MGKDQIGLEMHSWETMLTQGSRDNSHFAAAAAAAAVGLIAKSSLVTPSFLTYCGFQAELSWQGEYGGGICPLMKLT